MSASTAAVPETMEGLLAQNRAYRSLCASLEAQMAITTEKGRQYHEAVTTLDSERDANAILTDELTALRAQVSQLTADLEVAVAQLDRCRRHAQNIGIDSGSYFEELAATLNTTRKDG